MKNKKIILSGPPGTGKTTIIHELKKRGYNCIKEINPLHSNKEIRKNKLSISQFLFQKRKEQYNINNNNIVFYDRSMIDVVAYMNFWKEPYPALWDKVIQDAQYFNQIFYTPVWRKIYTPNKYRPEDYEETKKIDFFLKQTFLNFNYNIIEIPKLTVSKRVDFIINKI